MARSGGPPGYFASFKILDASGQALTSTNKCLRLGQMSNIILSSSLNLVPAMILITLVCACGPTTQDPSKQSTRPLSNQTRFRCEGKKRCSEMSSCEEATFYLQNCPGTEMDGDGDGVPCESQWCGRSGGRHHSSILNRERVIRGGGAKSIAALWDGLAVQPFN